MPNIETTRNNPVRFPLAGVVYDKKTFTVTSGQTYLEGTLLARDTSTNKYVVFVKGGSTNGNGVPAAILASEVVATATGDRVEDVALSGRVRKPKLVIHADKALADPSVNIDEAVLWQLRDMGLIALPVSNLLLQDN